MGLPGDWRFGIISPQANRRSVIIHSPSIEQVQELSNRYYSNILVSLQIGKVSIAGHEVIHSRRNSTGDEFIVFRIPAYILNFLDRIDDLKIGKNLAFTEVEDFGVRQAEFRILEDIP